MAEPKKRLTSTRSGKRRAHLKMVVKNPSFCPKCKSPVIPHHVCPNCGYYKGQDLLKIAYKTKAKEERRKARLEAEKESSAPPSGGSARSAKGGSREAK